MKFLFLHLLVVGGVKDYNWLPNMLSELGLERDSSFVRLRGTIKEYKILYGHDGFCRDFCDWCFEVCHRKKVIFIRFIYATPVQSRREECPDYTVGEGEAVRCSSYSR